MKLTLIRRSLRALGAPVAASDGALALGGRARSVRPAARVASLALAALVALAPFASPSTARAEEEPVATESSEELDSADLEASAVTATERFYNPYGDPWQAHRGPNPSIPIGLTPSCHRRGPNQGRTQRTAEELNFLIKSTSEILFEDCADIAEATVRGHNAILRSTGTFLAQRRPDIKYIGYLKGTIVLNKAQSGEGPYGVGLREIERMGREDWFVHVKGAPLTRENRIKVAGDDRDQLFDVTNPDFRRFYAQKIVESLEFHKMGGVGVDKCFKEPPLPPGQLSQVDDAKRAAWGPSCIDLLNQISTLGNPRGKLVFFLGLTAKKQVVGGQVRDVEDYEYLSDRLRVSNGFLWEDPFGALETADFILKPGGYLDRINTVLRLARQAGNKYVGIWVNTNQNNPGYSGNTTRDREHLYARYYLASYLSILPVGTQAQKTPLIHFTPTATSPQFHSAAFFRQWNLQVGPPTGPLREVRRGPGGSVLQRRFQKGWVVLNNSSATYTIDFGRVPANQPLFTTVYDQGRERLVRVPCNSAGRCTFTVPRKSGWIFADRATIDRR